MSLIPEGEVRAFDLESNTACVAPEEVFLPDYEQVPAVLRAIIEQEAGIPCEGGGIPGRWCEYGKGISPCPWYRSQSWLENEKGLSFDDLDPELNVSADE